MKVSHFWCSISKGRVLLDDLWKSFHYSDFLLESYYKMQDHHYNSKTFSLSFNGSNFWFRMCTVHDSEFQLRKLEFYICILVRR